MPLTESEVNLLLHNPFLHTLPVTKYEQDYKLYQGCRNVTPLTFPFNLGSTFESCTMMVYMQQKLTS